MLRTQRILEFEKFDVYNMRGQPLQIKEGRNSHRSSQFRGVSKNGKKWQVRIVSAHNLFLLQMMIVKGFIRKYIGAFICEEDAARTYDKFALCFWGQQARINFTYDREQIIELLSEEEANQKVR